MLVLKMIAEYELVRRLVYVMKLTSLLTAVASCMCIAQGRSNLPIGNVNSYSNVGFNARVITCHSAIFSNSYSRENQSVSKKAV
jgi:hypothetical protein